VKRFIGNIHAERFRAHGNSPPNPRPGVLHPVVTDAGSGMLLGSIPESILTVSMVVSGIF
jgi:hypothetical protein